MCFRASGTLGEQAGGFDDDVRAHAGPVDFRGILGLEYLEALAIDADGVVRMGNLVRKVSQDRVIFQKMRQGLGIRDVVHGYKLNVLVIQRCAHDIATDAAEAVDSNLDWHASSGGG